MGTSWEIWWGHFRCNLCNFMGHACPMTENKNDMQWNFCVPLSSSQIGKVGSQSEDLIISMVNQREFVHEWYGWGVWSVPYKMVYLHVKNGEVDRTRVSHPFLTVNILRWPTCSPHPIYSKCDFGAILCKNWHPNDVFCAWLCAGWLSMNVRDTYDVMM